MRPHHNLSHTFCLSAALLLTAGTVLPVRGDYASSILGLNPLAYWRFNETAVSPAFPTATNASSVGAAATGDIVMDVNQGEPGIVGNCARFNNAGGTGHDGSKIDVPYLAAINPNTPFTIEFWAKPNSISTDVNGYAPVSGMAPYFFGANRSGWIFYLGSGGKWQVRVGGENSYTGIVGPVNTGLASVGTWQHVAGVFDGSALLLYVNGVLVGSGSASAGFNPNQWMAIRIGGSPFAGDLGFDSGNRGWDGWLDEVAVYPTALSANTLAAHFSAATTNNPGYHAQILADGPVGYWTMDEGVYTPPDPSTYPTAANSGSVGSDATGTNELGVLAAQPVLPYAGFGPGNQACFFNGESGYLSLSNPPALGNLTGPITLMAWIKPTVRGGVRDIIAHGYDNNNAETYLRIGDTVDWEGSGSPNTAYYEIGESPNGSTYNSAVFPMPAGDVGNWVFLAGTWDGANWNLYRNGQLVAQAADTAGPVMVTNRWSIGSRSDPSPGFGMFFGGWIDEPAIFGTALSASDIQSLYLAAQVPPTITEAPQAPAASVYEGSVVSFSVWAEGNPTLTYQWTKNGSPLGGQTGTNLTLTGVTVASSGTYAVVVSNPFGSVTSSVPLVVLTSPPVLVTQPQPAARYSGFGFNFSVSAIGSAPISYQWNLGGTPVAGATDASYTGTAQNGVAGNYTCVLTNVYGSVTSAVATLTVVAHPAGYASAVLADSPVAYYRLDETNGTTAHDLTGGNDGVYFNCQLNQPGYSQIDPDPAIVVSGGLNEYVGNISGTGSLNFPGPNAEFSVEAWVKGGAQNDGATIIAKGTGSNGGTANEQFCLDVSSGVFRFFTRGAANNMYAATAASGPDGAWHYVVGVYDSASAVITIYVDGQVSGTGGTLTSGVRASSALVSIGSKRDGVDVNYGDTFNGTIDEVAVYSTALSAGQVATHYASAYGSGLPPTISHQPVSLTNYISLPGSFSVSAYGTVPLSFQWNKGGVPLVDDGVHIFGSSSSVLTINPLGFADDGTYSVTITNVIGVLASSNVTLTVLAAPASPSAIPGLVMHLPFDGSLIDATGRGNNGSARGAPTFVPDGMLGSALHYYTMVNTTNAGSSYFVTSANYVNVGVRPDLQFSSNINFTVAYWIRLPANYLGGDLPFFTDATNSTFGAGYLFAPSYGSDGQPPPAAGAAWNGGWAMSLYDNTAANGFGVYGDVGSINDGNWHSLVHVFDRRTGATTYLDGVVAHFTREAGTSAVDAGDIDLPNAPATIGQDPSGQYVGGGDNASPGPGILEASADIDDLGVWHRALSPLEAASIFMGAVSNRVSFVGAPIQLTLTTSTNGLSLAWPAGTLQSADNVAGPYISVTPVSPFTVSPSAPQKFYRVKL